MVKWLMTFKLGSRRRAAEAPSPPGGWPVVASGQLGDPALGSPELLDEVPDRPVERRRGGAVPLLVEARAGPQLAHHGGHAIRADLQAVAFEVRGDRGAIERLGGGTIGHARMVSARRGPGIGPDHRSGIRGTTSPARPS